MFSPDGATLYFSSDRSGISNIYALDLATRRLSQVTNVRTGAFLGLGVTVIPGLVVGAWSTVGAGSAVIRPVEEGFTVAGCPARPIRQRLLVEP